MITRSTVRDRDSVLTSFPPSPQIQADQLRAKESAEDLYIERQRVMLDSPLSLQVGRIENRGNGPTVRKSSFHLRLHLRRA